MDEAIKKLFEALDSIAGSFVDDCDPDGLHSAILETIVEWVESKTDISEAFVYKQIIQWMVADQTK